MKITQHVGVSTPDTVYISTSTTELGYICERGMGPETLVTVVIRDHEKQTKGFVHLSVFQTSSGRLSFEMSVHGKTQIKRQLAAKINISTERER